MTTPNQPDVPSGVISTFRTLLIGLILVVVVLGLAVVTMTMGRAGTEPVEPVRVDALANSNDSCVTCHRNSSPGIVEQFSHSSMALADVGCRDCHEVASDYPGAVEHEGAYVLAGPTPAMCQKCHQQQVAEFNQSRHAAPAYAAIKGVSEFTPEQVAMYQAIPEGGYVENKPVNGLYTVEGPEITRFACHQCHDIGRPNPDGSIGSCRKCHLRHEFSIEQARKPETCNACHIGPDHPQYEIYIESPHGIAYMTGGDDWNWDVESGTQTVSDFPAPTCATCHMSGFGTSGTTHDLGDRLTWYLFGSVSERRPAWQDNMARMKGVCFECHNENFINEFYENADLCVEAVNERALYARELIAPLKENGLLTAAPFDQPVDFLDFDIWHHWGRTTKFGTWMQGPDYAQWHGIYEMLRDISEMEVIVEEEMHKAGLPYEPPSTDDTE